MKDLRDLSAKEKGVLIEKGLFYKGAPAVALKPDGSPVLVKPTGQIYRGYFPCKALGPCLSGEKVEVQGNRACHLDNVWALLSLEEATEMAAEMPAERIEQLEFLNF